MRGEYNKDLCGKYPELNDNLQQELEFFRIKFSSSYSSLEECRQLFVKMTKEVRSMFPQVEQLLRLLLISPASSCEAERSFSALRRVKTWLRSTMTHDRLNNVMMCHVHKNILDSLDCNIIAKQFVENCPQTRSKIFGKVIASEAKHILRS